MAIGTFDKGNDSDFGKLVHTGDHENPMSKMIKEITDKLDEISVKLNTVDTATIANTAKVSMAGGSATTLSFGEMITIPPKVKGGATTYHIIMTATKGGVAKTVTLILT